MTSIYRVFEAHAPATTIGLFEYGWSPAGCFAVEALSDYAEREGFGRYDEMEPWERQDFVWCDTVGFAGAVFTNTEICATLVGRRVAS